MYSQFLAAADGLVPPSERCNLLPTVTKPEVFDHDH
jgi:hypothetical protein